MKVLKYLVIFVLLLVAGVFVYGLTLPNTSHAQPLYDDRRAGVYDLRAARQLPELQPVVPVAAVRPERQGDMKVRRGALARSSPGHRTM